MKYFVLVFVLAVFLDGVAAAQPLDPDNLPGHPIQQAERDSDASSR